MKTHTHRTNEYTTMFVVFPYLGRSYRHLFLCPNRHIFLQLVILYKKNSMKEGLIVQTQTGHISYITNALCEGIAGTSNYTEHTIPWSFVRQQEQNFQRAPQVAQGRYPRRERNRMLTLRHYTAFRICLQYI